MPDTYWVNGGGPKLPGPSLTLAEMGVLQGCAGPPAAQRHS